LDTLWQLIPVSLQKTTSIKQHLREAVLPV
jgi:hypothetical protein